MPRLTLYQRRGCHLCDDMWQHLQDLARSGAFELEVVDVDSDAGLRERFGARVPVLAGGGEVICNYYLDPVALACFLERQGQDGLRRCETGLS